MTSELELPDAHLRLLRGALERCRSRSHTLAQLEAAEEQESCRDQSAQREGRDRSEERGEESRGREQSCRQEPDSAECEHAVAQLLAIHGPLRWCGRRHQEPLTS